MRYKILWIDQNKNRFGREGIIYVLPRGAEAEQYLVIYPATLEQELRRLVISGSYSICWYKGLPTGVIEALRENLISRAEKRLARLKNRGANMFAAGTVIAVFGLLNWFIPDPLPLADELILTFGGAAIALAGYGRRKRGTEEFERRGDIVRGDIDSVMEQEDAFLSHCAEAIREKPFSRNQGNGETGIDRLEEESRWLVKYTDIDSLIATGTCSPEEAARFFHLLNQAVPLERLVSAEGWGDRKKRRQRKGLIQRLTARYGFSLDALTFYASLFASCREYFRERGEKFP